MHIAKIKMDRVFDIVQDPTRRGTSATLFSFEANGKRHFSVSIDGRPRLEDGMEVVAVLHRSNDWQSLIGWKDLGTGLIHMPKQSASLLTMAMTFPVFIAVAGGYYSTGSLWLLLGCVAFSVAYLTVMDGVRRTWQAKRMLMQACIE